MQTFLDKVAESIYFPPDLQEKLFSSIVFILVLWLIQIVLRRIVFRLAVDTKQSFFWRKTILYIVYGLGILGVGRIWMEGFASLTTFLGLLSAGFAIALKDLIVNLAGWAFIIIRSPFEVGDRIQIGELTGDVIDIRIFQFTILEIGNWVDAEQSTGRIIHVPNGIVFQTPQANYDKGFHYIWNEIPVLITFESNWRKAREILDRIAKKQGQDISQSATDKIKKASQKFFIYYSKLDPIVYLTVKDSGVLLTIRYLCEPRNRRNSSQEIWESVLTEFELHHDIDFAYPTQRLFNHLSEGKKAPTGEEPIDPREMEKNQETEG